MKAKLKKKLNPLYISKEKKRNGTKNHGLEEIKNDFLKNK